jgi:hypothetical protein
MKPMFDIARGLVLPAAALCAALFIADAHSEQACPQLLESRSGSVFNMSAFIADNGSPRAALDEVRLDVSKIDQGGGCHLFRNTAACEETLTLARQAIAALEACAQPGRQEK